MADATPMYDLIKTLTEIPGPTGEEERVHEWCAEHWSERGAQVRITPVGNVVAKVGGQGPKLVVMAHGDELGLIIKSITTNGLLHIWPPSRDMRGRPAYWYNPVNSPVVVLGARGDVDGQLVYASGHVKGGSNQQGFEWNDWFIDVGASSREEVEALGIHPGCRMAINMPTRRLGDTIVGKAMDDRAPLAVVTSVLERAELGKLQHELWVASTIQEENGLIGASSIPDVADFGFCINLDVGLCGDVPGTSEVNHPAKLRQGPIVVYQDSSVNYSPRMSRRLVETAEQAGIPVQQAVFQNYGSDGAEMIRRGVETTLMTMPTRYTHSPNEMVTESDCVGCVDLILAYLEREPLPPRWPKG